MKFLATGMLCLPLMFAAPGAEDQAEGRALYRSNCAFCHGLTLGGGRGPALVGRQLLHGSAASDLRAVIRDGVPGSTMPSFDRLEKDEMDSLVAFLLGMREGSGHSTPVSGNADRGRQLYQRTGCAGCHRIGREGSVFGPELTRIGAGRSSDYLRESLVNPSADVPEEYQGVTVVTRDGKRIGGVRVNEDTFSVQLRDMSQNFRMFQKDAVREVVHETKSLMPAYSSLPKDDLNDLLAYLDTLRGETKTGADVKKSEGIR